MTLIPTLVAEAMVQTTTHISAWQHIFKFFDSSFFLALTTLAIGLVALLVYYKQKIDQKKDAARIILLEVKNAERKLQLARDSILINDRLPETTFAMKSSSWNKYSHLFANDFSDNDWDLINTFYEKCHTYDEIIENGRTFFGKNEEQARVNLHATVAEFTKVYVKKIREAAEKDEKEREKLNKSAYDEYYDLMHSFADNYIEEELIKDYKSDKPFKDANNLILTIKTDLSTTAIGTTLKNIINQNFRSAVHDSLLGKRKVYK